MNVAIVHYHLEPGGVTRVIENTVHAFSRLPNSPNVAVLSGREYKGKVLESVGTVEGLDYSTRKDSPDPSILRERLETAAQKVLGKTPDLWHIHNHSLGKNPALPHTLKQLAENGHPLLLHIHDFAEDGRPENYLALEGTHHCLYPLGSRIGYALLNERDLGFIKDAFGCNQLVRLLPNSIARPPPADHQNVSKGNIPKNLNLYPVRAVRRKNLGELALLAASYPERHFANSLGPTNPAFKKTYDRWEYFSEAKKLPLTFGLNQKIGLPFHQLVNASQTLITTSVAEGFGMGFLEPWTFGKSVIGRNLPEVTSDFSGMGVDLSHLYHRIELPTNLLKDQSILESLIPASLENLFKAYRIELPPDSYSKARKAIEHNGQLDFGRLNEDIQEEMICAAKDSEEIISEIRRQTRLQALPQHTINENALAVEKNFSEQTYASRLWEIYEKLVASNKSPTTYADSKKVLLKFLRPERLNLLRN